MRMRGPVMPVIALAAAMGAIGLVRRVQENKLLANAHYCRRAFPDFRQCLFCAVEVGVFYHDSDVAGGFRSEARRVAAYGERFDAVPGQGGHNGGRFDFTCAPTTTARDGWDRMS